MKLIWLVSAALMLILACTDDIKIAQKSRADTARGEQVKPAYDDSWYISPGWPGEYPNGFTVLADGVWLAGRTKMNKARPKSLQCPVMRLANYNPWNHERIAADKLKFVAAVKTFPVKMNADANVPGVRAKDEQDTTLSLLAGDELTYLTYIAEGFALMRHEAVDYQVNEADLEGIADFGGPAAAAYDLWVEIPCADGKRGWVLYAELQGMDGIGETEHTEYGVARDLKE